MRLPTSHLRDGNLLRKLEAELAILQPPGRGAADWLAVIKLAEWEELRNHLGPQGCSAVVEAVSRFIRSELPSGVRILQTYNDEITLIVSDRTEKKLARMLLVLSRLIVSRPFLTSGERVRVTPAIGYAPVTRGRQAASCLHSAQFAVSHSLAHLDLRPTAFSELPEAPSGPREWMSRPRLVPRAQFAFHSVIVLLLAAAMPFLIYLSLPGIVADIASTFMFILTVVVLVTTATLINIEGILSLRPETPPDAPLTPYPPASAIIAAYLPNEAASVVETVEAMLALDYPAPLQIILAYNTPHDLPVERTLRRIARRDARFVPLRVDGSTSKAQNINAALSLLTGEFTAIFDADHHPQGQSFTRAWRWLSDGADVVQGHCVVRNGSATLLSRIIAVEFEQIYAVAHPGGGKLRGYGIFGGSNGYWRTSLLREIRMRSSMLTEDIDSSMRAVVEGHRIVSDPCLISTELAPVTLRSLTHQRLRWNQGWFQVSLQHLKPLLMSKKLSPRQKIGTFYLLAWRELFPWLSLQVFPVVAYWTTKAGSIYALDWKVPILLAATAYVLSTGPIQSLIAYANAAPELRKKGSWFLLHLLFFHLYSEYLTMLTRVAHLRQLFGVREWRITSRSAPVGAPVSPATHPRTVRELRPPEQIPHAPQQQELSSAHRAGSDGVGSPLAETV